MKVSWLDLPYKKSELSRKARRGEDIARTLRRWYAPDWAHGIKLLARSHNVSERTIRRWINQAGQEIRSQPHSEPRSCKICPALLPADSTKGRQYCDTHAASNERVRRHRALRASPPRTNTTPTRPAPTERTGRGPAKRTGKTAAENA